jgi:hypothetical protein
VLAGLFRHVQERLVQREGSTSGVIERKIAITCRETSRNVEPGLTRMACGRSRGARLIGIAECTPNGPRLVRCRRHDARASGGRRPPPAYREAPAGQLLH